MTENREKQKLLLRIRRIRGQLDGIERGLANDQGSAKILQTAAATRGALDGFIGEIIAAEIENVVDPDATTAERLAAGVAFIDIVHAYLK